VHRPSVKLRPMGLAMPFRNPRAAHAGD
jgi:hypothetical protein